jgi:hypothetical protein
MLAQVTRIGEDENKKGRAGIIKATIPLTPALSPRGEGETWHIAEDSFAIGFIQRIDGLTFSNKKN